MLTRLQIYAAVALAAAAFIVTVFLYGRKDGQTAAQRDMLKRALENAKRARKIEQNVDRLSDDDVDRRLRERWRR